MLYRVYVDEAGDRGVSPTSDRHFVVSAVIVPDAADRIVRSELAELRQSLCRHPAHVLHFVKFNHSERLKAVQDVANFSFATIANVVVRKDRIHRPHRRTDSAHISRPDPMYLWALRLLLKRISWYIQDVGGDGAVVTFSHLKGFKSQKLHDYRLALESSAGIDIHWPVFDGHRFRIKGAKSIELLQIADITASALFKAVEPDVFGNTETRYLNELRPKLYRRAGASITSFGLKTFPAETSNPGEPLAFLRDF